MNVAILIKSLRKKLMKNHPYQQANCNACETKCHGAVIIKSGQRLSGYSEVGCCKFTPIKDTFKFDELIMAYPQGIQDVFTHFKFKFNTQQFNFKK
jgi:hypothetical protein